ncbi:MAG: hypothetical protein EOP10_10650 [Proteobacteria bacterium]|nr:MAG: hypothetical protein EOP10_10650 [Pseudomonadota bacterium]
MNRTLKTQSYLSRTLVLTLLFSLTSACGPQDAASGLKADAQSSNQAAVQKVLGLGMDHSRGVQLSPCIDTSSYVFSGTTSSSVSYLGDYSSTQLLDEKGIGVSSGFNLLGLLKAKVSGDVTTELATTDDTSSFIYKFDISGKSAVLNSTALNARGWAAYQSRDPAVFRSVCGDSYIEQAKMGAQLFLGVKYDFTSRGDKEKIRLLLKGSALWGLIKFSKTWTKEERDLLRNVRVRITAHQVGGDPNALLALKAQLESSNCPGDLMEPCTVSLNSLLKYASDTFPKQLNELKVSADANVGPAILNIVTVPYSDQALFDPSLKKLVTLPSLDDQTPLSFLAQSLETSFQLQSDLAIELSRRNALLSFALNDEERQSVTLSKESLERLTIETQTLLSRCSQPNLNLKEQDRCLVDLADLETRGREKIMPLELASRL